MVMCAVANCKYIKRSNYADVTCSNGVPLSFFRFPIDSEQRAEWIRRCGREDTINPDNARVCSAHFLKEDYDSSYLTKCLLGLKLRPVIRKGVVPSQNLLPGCSSTRLKGGVAAAADPTVPLDPVQRSAIVQEAIADLGKREQEEREHGPQKHLSSLTAATRKWRVSEEDNASCATEVSDDRSVKSDDESAANACELDQQFKVLSRLQRQTRTLERRLADKRRQLKEATEQRALSLATLTALARGDRERPNGKGDTAPTPDRREAETCGDPLVVLRSEQYDLFPDLPPANDLFTVPTDVTEAKRVIFNLRQEVLALRKCVLKQAHGAAALRIEMLEKDVKRDVKHAALVRRLRDALDLVFTSAQQSHLLPGKTVVPWGAEDYLRSISLRRLCRQRTFEFVRTTMKIPLPSMYSVCSMASYGRFPEVTRRYRALRERKKLRFRAKKPDQSDTDASEDPNPTDGQVPKRQNRKEGIRPGSKRKRKAERDELEKRSLEPELESEPVQPTPRRLRWNAVDLTGRVESSSSGDEAWADRVHVSPHVLGPPRGLGRGRGSGRGRQRTGRSKRMAVPSGGKRSHGSADDVVFSQAPDYLHCTPPPVELQPVSRGWAGRDRPDRWSPMGRAVQT